MPVTQLKQLSIDISLCKTIKHGSKIRHYVFYLPNLDKPNQKVERKLRQIPQIFANKG